MIDVFCQWYNDTDFYDKELLDARRRQRFRDDESNPRIKWMEEPSDDVPLNGFGSPYKVIMNWICGGRQWKMIRYKGQNYIGGFNLLRFRLYRGKLNYLDAIKFLNNHLHRADFANDIYKNYVYPLIK